jgi:RHS repeat-associated protein
MDYGWLGQHQRPYEHAGALSIVQMGARPYSPLLGRFLSVDPVDGGSANDYDYGYANPCNNTDLDGRKACGSRFKITGKNGGLYLNRAGGGINKYGQYYYIYEIQVRLKLRPNSTPIIAKGEAYGKAWDHRRSSRSGRLWQADSTRYGRPHSNQFVHAKVRVLAGTELRFYGYALGVEVRQIGAAGVQINTYGIAGWLRCTAG